MNEVEIRRFQESDVNEIHETIMLSVETSVLTKVYEPDRIDEFRRLYTPEYIADISRQRHMYVAVYDQKIVGCAAVSLVDGRAYVSCVYINPNYQGLGIGRKLLEALEKDEISVRAGTMFLHAVLTAKKFYEKLGYYVEDDIPEIIVEIGVEFIELVKKL